MNIWHDIDPSRISAEDFIAVIEIEKGSKNKYEMDKETGMLLLDRILYTSTHYPANYGFIPRTYAQDNDPLDVLVLSSESITSMALVRCYPIGVISMVDGGDADEKIIAIPYGDPTYHSYRDIGALPQHIFNEMSHFFSVYKALENKETAVDKTMGRDAAITIIQQSIDAYREKFHGEETPLSTP
ncbi:inorganic diphosphatase [Eubacteriales bacterium OttesenSCG-928-M02]|nr:inorganic diphosphatase [Eubacteriales bacterium OttesenSCG-928-M02]